MNSYANDFYSGDDVTVRVAHVVPSLALSQGGLRTAVLEIARGTGVAGVQSRIITTHLSGETTGAVDLPAPSLGVRSYKASSPLRLRNSWPMISRLRQDIADVDVVHIHGLYSLPAIYATLAARAERKPWIIQPHGMLESEQAEQGLKLAKRIFRTVAVPLMIDSAFSIVATSAREEREIRIMCDGADMVEVLPLGVSRNTTRNRGFSVRERESMTRWMSAPQEKRFLFLGRYTKKKNPHLLLSAWRDSKAFLESAQLLIAGNDDDLTSSQLELRIMELGIQDSVTLVGPLYGEDKFAAFQNAGVFVLPSARENFGFTVAEAIQAGCSVITTSGVDSADVVSKYGTGEVLTSLDVHLLADAIRRRVHSRALVTLERNASIDAAREFDWQAKVKGYLSCYVRAAGKIPVRRGAEADDS